MSLPAQREYSSSPVDFDEFQVVSLFGVKLKREFPGKELINDPPSSGRNLVHSGTFFPL